jgi:hypothetical protein
MPNHLLARRVIVGCNDVEMAINSKQLQVFSFAIIQI